MLYNPINAAVRTPRAAFLLSVLTLFFASNCFSVQQAWIAKYASGPGSTNPPAGIAVDRDGNVYVAASSTRSMPPFDLDYLVVKYSPLGVQLWTNRFGNEGVDETVRGFVLATNGNVYLTGTAGTIKYNSSGLPAWSTSHAGRDITIDSNENCYVTGFIDTDFSVVKLDAGGSNLWTKTWNYANQQDISHVIAVDHAGSVWIAGLATLFCDRLQCHLEFWAVRDRKSVV